MRLAVNMAAGVANSIVVVLVNIIALPFYLRFLGMEAYGLIGFYVTLQAVLQVLDFGLAPTVSREVARGAETGQLRRASSLLRTLGVLYFGIALVIVVLVVVAAPWIGSHWLQAKSLPGDTVVLAIALMGVNLACRWPTGLYHGALVGVNRLAFSAATSMAINVAAAVTTVAVLAWGARSIQAFFIVQAGFGLLQTIMLRILARRAVGECDAPYDFAGLRRVLSFSVWMSGTAITSIVLTQLDKALLSRLIDLESLGYYMLAALLVSGLSVLTGPAFNVIYPKLAVLYARGDHVGLERFYSDISRMYAAALFSLALALALHVKAIVTLWTGRSGVAADVAPLVMLLIVGSTMNAIMYFPYALQLASGRPRIPFFINVVMLAMTVPTIVWLATRYGATGGALSWALFGVVALIVGVVVTGRKVEKFAGASWLTRDVALPSALALIPALAGVWVSSAFNLAPWSEVVVASIAAGIGFVAGVLYSPFARLQVKILLRTYARSCLY